MAKTKRPSAQPGPWCEGRSPQFVGLAGAAAFVSDFDSVFASVFVSVFASDFASPLASTAGFAPLPLKSVAYQPLPFS